MPDLNGDLKKFEEQNTLAFRFQHILKVAQHAPYERVMQGWFENYLSLKQFTLLDSVSFIFHFFLLRANIFLSFEWQKSI